MLKKDKQRSVFLFVFNTLLTTIKQTLKINKTPSSWQKAIGAAICAGFPLIIGILVGQLNMGLLGVIGSFTYLYVFNEPYAERSKKIFFVAIGISFSVALGTLVAPYPILVVLLVGLIGTTSTFIFGVIRIPGPAALFFVLSFVMTTGMPINPSLAAIRTAIVLMSGSFAWIISMIGCFFNPHGPEVKAVKEVYLALVAFSEAIGSENINSVRQRTVNALKESEQTLLKGYISWKNSLLFNKLSLLNDQANMLFLEMLELYNGETKLPKELCEMIRKLSMGIKLNDGEKIIIDQLPKEIDQNYHDFLDIIYDTEAIINLPLIYIGHGIKISKPSLRMKFIKACDKDSIVFINAIRFGIVLSISTIIAFYFPFNRPYWIPLSCTSVMLGSTIMSTFHRAIQRACGTIIGLMLGINILKLQPEGYMIAIIIVCLTILVELLIAKNFGLSVVFITPITLLLASVSNAHTVIYFAKARITDILIGSLIGLIGTYIIGRRSASSRLPGLTAKLIRNQSQLLVQLTSNRGPDISDCTKFIKEKMQINLMNFKMAYTTALGEIPNNQEMLELMWPTVFSTEHVCYLLDTCCAKKGYLNLADEKLAQLLQVFEKMATAIEQKQVIQNKNVAILNGKSNICLEIKLLQDAIIANSIHI
ncbi:MULTISPECIES: FUSC family protein [Clostridium]|uniref:FUSC family protein n=1 Tax=Clostridium frigoriphilum TaxID=443253 RepID=A0ABU7UVG4_9CLOT|nr:FUSC family protein [Clostridium sp. DSM 17811]MBU3102443.1 FUSC family protein [Clostridium sp. DSM 17811]